AVTTPTGSKRLCKVFTYDAANRIKKTDYRQGSPTATLLATESNTFDRYGNVLSETDAQGVTTTHGYDTQFRKTSEVVDPSGLARTTTFTYGSLTGGGGSSCSCTGLPHPTRITTPEGIITEFDYDMLGRKTSQTIAPNTPHATTTSYTYDALGRVATTTSPDGVVTTNTYDNDSGRLVSVNKASPAGYTPAFSHTTTYTYDTNFGLTKTTFPDGTSENLGYNSPKRQLIQKDIRTASNTIVWKETYTYNTLGRLYTRRDGMNNTTTYTYDTYGRNTGVKRPDTRQQTTAFDFASNPITVTGYDGLATTLRHDIFGRNVSTTHPDGSSSATYEAGPGGKMLTSTRQGVTTTFTFDNAGRITTTTTGSTVATHSYNDTLRQQSTTSAGRTTTTTRDLAGRVSSVQTGNALQTTSYARSGGKFYVTTATDPNGLNLQSTVAYDGLGRKIAETDANGDTTSYYYDSRSRMTSYTNARGKTFSFQYDAAGHRTRRTEPDATYQTYTYDLAGNLTAHRKADNVTLTTTYNALNLPMSQTAGSSGQFINWSYDMYGRLAAMENQDVILSYGYIAGHSLVDSETTTIKGIPS
ncbi:MAG: RHS repeat protein, partial [Hyphomicrobiales bacterium]|nr:RHS repeat protein [Hyphomicrobiales bacterium]